MDFNIGMLIFLNYLIYAHELRFSKQLMLLNEFQEPVPMNILKSPYIPVFVRKDSKLNLGTPLDDVDFTIIIGR